MIIFKNNCKTLIKSEQLFLYWYALHETCTDRINRFVNFRPKCSMSANCKTL